MTFSPEPMADVEFAAKLLANTANDRCADFPRDRAGRKRRMPPRPRRHSMKPSVKSVVELVVWTSKAM